MRPYTDDELAILKDIERQAEREAIRCHGHPGATACVRSANWSFVFHRELESRGVAAGLKQPRSFFERRSNGLNHS